MTDSKLLNGIVYIVTKDFYLKINVVLFFLICFKLFIHQRILKKVSRLIIDIYIII